MQIYCIEHLSKRNIEQALEMNKNYIYNVANVYRQ